MRSDCLPACDGRERRAPGRSAQERVGSARPRLAGSGVAAAREQGYPWAQVRQSIADVIALLPKLATGVDVNVRFHDVHAFEYTDDVAIFPLLDIDLVHGWLVEPRVRPWAANCLAAGWLVGDKRLRRPPNHALLRRRASRGWCRSVRRGGGWPGMRRCGRPAAGPALRPCWPRRAAAVA